MLKQEFETLVGRTVTKEQFDAIVILYVNSHLEKAEFVESIRGMLESIPEEKPYVYKKMRIEDQEGNQTISNTKIHYIKWVRLMDIDAETGKYIVKKLSDRELRKIEEELENRWHEEDFDCEHIECLAKRWDSLQFSEDFDFDYTECVDWRAKEPISKTGGFWRRSKGDWEY